MCAVHHKLYAHALRCALCVLQAAARNADLARDLWEVSAAAVGWQDKDEH
jgi:hypothetical protein